MKDLPLVLLEISLGAVNMTHTLVTRLLHLLSKLPSATINFHPDLLLLLGYHLPFLTEAELEVALVWFQKRKK